MIGENRSPYAKKFEVEGPNMSQNKDFSFVAVTLIAMLLIIASLSAIIYLQAQEIDKRPLIYHTTEVIKPQHLYPKIPVNLTVGTYRLHCKYSVKTLGVVQATSDSCGSGWGINLTEYGMPEHRYLITAAHVVLAGPDEKFPVDSVEVQIRTDKIKKWVKCKPLVVDRDADTAVLEAEEDLPIIFNLADDEEIGAPVIIGGCPVGTTPSTQIGWLTSKDPEIPTKLRYPIWQAFAQFYKGNSGGPMIDADSQKVVGMLVAGLRLHEGEDQMVPGLAICIPCFVIRAVLDKNFRMPEEPAPLDERLKTPPATEPKAEIVPLSP